MERLIELILSLLLSLGVAAPPGLGGSTPGGPPADAPPAGAAGQVSGVAARVMAAVDHAEGVLAWAACVAEAAATAAVPRDETFDPRAGCGSLPVPPDEAVEGDEQAGGAPVDVPPVDVPPVDVPPVDVPPVDVPPVDVPPVDVPPAVPLEIPPLDVPPVDVPPVVPPIDALP